MVVLQAFPVLAVVVAAYNFAVVLGSRAVGDVIREVIDHSPRRPEENEKALKHAETDGSEVAGARARR